MLFPWEVVQAERTQVHLTWPVIWDGLQLTGLHIYVQLGVVREATSALLSNCVTSRRRKSLLRSELDDVRRTKDGKLFRARAESDGEYSRTIGGGSDS